MITFVVIIIIGVVGYYHYTQGFFSSTISAILAVLAAVFAVAWHERFTDAFLGGRFADQAHAITLAGIFVLSYSLGRFVFDKLVPGNLRFPAVVDKTGAGVMGIIAGIACAGVAMIAAQTLPFSESILWWERYEVTFDKATAISREGFAQQLDAKFNELTAEKFLNNQPNTLVVPADDILLALVSRLSSENGSLSTNRPWTGVHPDYLQELFGQRVSQLPAARHCALAGKISVSEVCSEVAFEQLDQERFVTPQKVPVGTRSKMPGLKPIRNAGANSVFLVVRAKLDAENRDLKTDLITFPAAAARLCLPLAGDPAAGGPQAANYFPIGTLIPDRRLYANQPDDMLFALPNKVVEFVFEVPKSALGTDAKNASLPDGAFFEFKRLARADLGGLSVKPYRMIAPLPESAVLRKTGLPGANEGTSPGTGTANTASSNGVSNPDATATATDIPNVPLGIIDIPVNTTGQLPSGIGVGASGRKQKDVPQDWGTCSIDDGKFTDIELDPVQPVMVMARRPNPVNMLGTGPGKRAVIVWARVRKDATDKWAWAGDVRSFAFADSSNNRYPLAGVIVKLKNSGGQDMLNIVYDGMKPGPISYAPGKDARQMVPSDIGLIFVVPQGAQMGNLMFKNEVARNLPATVN